jgi:hypothetical protein
MYALCAGLGCLLIVAASFLVLAHIQRGSSMASAFAYTANGAQQSLGIDPNRLEEPTAYDSRPCVQHASDATCSGLYPVTPPHVSPELGKRNGAGACIDRASKVVENQPFTDTQGHAVGNLEITWLPTCQSYYGHVSFAFALNRVTHIEIWSQTESDSNFVQWFEAFSGLAPAVHHTQQTGPVQGADLTHQELYSPLIYAPGAPTSVYVDIRLADGSEYMPSTASFAAGVYQYNGVP